MRIINGCYYDENFDLASGDIYIDDASRVFIDKSFSSDEEVIDASGLIATPCFIDSHIHGAFGADCSDLTSSAISCIASKITSKGVVAFCPTTMTIAEKDIYRAFSSINSAQDELSDSDAEILGVHLEGPLLNSDFCGVQDKSLCINPSDAFNLIDSIESLYPGLLKIIDIAPEQEGAIEFIKTFSPSYIISLAHTASDYEMASKAFDAGASRVTHILNAMNGCEKRAPGIVGASFDNDHVFCEIICDGIHIDPSVLRMLFKLYGEDRTIVISDSMRGCGMPDGEYLLGSAKVEVKNGRTYYGSNKGLAGSVTDLASEYKKLISIGIPAKQVVKSMTINVLSGMNLTSEQTGLGVITVGNKASLNLFDEDGNLKMVIINGVLKHDYRSIGQEA